MKTHAELELENDQIRQALLEQEADYKAQLETKESAYMSTLKSKDRYIVDPEEFITD